MFFAFVATKNTYDEIRSIFHQCLSYIIYIKYRFFLCQYLLSKWGKLFGFICNPEPKLIVSGLQNKKT